MDIEIVLERFLMSIIYILPIKAGNSLYDSFLHSKNGNIIKYAVVFKLLF